MISKPVRIPKEQSIDLSGRSIEVIVGADPPVSFSVHENLICARSTFFKTAAMPEWLEGAQRSIHLREDDPDTFLLYLQWLYIGKIPIRIDAPGLVGNAEYVRLAKAYVLGDKLGDGVFQDVAIDMIVDKCRSEATDGNKWHPVGEAVEYIYENTLPGSKARCLLADLYVARGSGRWLYDYMTPHKFPKDFLLDLATNLLDKKVNDPTIKKSLCEYHQHEFDVKPCYRASFEELQIPKS